MIRSNDIYNVAIIWEADDLIALLHLTAEVCIAFNDSPANVRYSSDNRKAYLLYCFTEHKQSPQVISLQEFNEMVTHVKNRLKIIFENDFNQVKINERYPLNPAFAEEFNKPEYHHEINQ